MESSSVVDWKILVVLALAAIAIFWLSTGNNDDRSHQSRQAQAVPVRQGTATAAPSSATSPTKSSIEARKVPLSPEAAALQAKLDIPNGCYISLSAKLVSSLLYLIQFKLFTQAVSCCFSILRSIIAQKKIY